MFHFLFHLSFHHSRCDAALSLFASKCIWVRRYAIRLTPCDLGDPGWGDPWFPHGAVLLPSPACMALFVFWFLLLRCLVCFGSAILGRDDTMLPSLHESTKNWLPVIVCLLWVLFWFGFCVLCLFGFVLGGFRCLLC